MNKFLDSSGVKHLWEKSKELFDTTDELTEITRILDTSVLSDGQTETFLYWYPPTAMSIDQEFSNSDNILIMCMPFDTDLISNDELDLLYENIPINTYLYNWNNIIEEYTLSILNDNKSKMLLIELYYSEIIESFSYNYNTKEREGRVYNKLQTLLKYTSRISDES